MSDKESDNYYRLITLVVNTGTRTLREVFKKHTGNDTVSVLKKHRQTIDTLKNGRKRVLSEPQYQRLIADNPDLETFDISLLVILIRNICINVKTPQNKGWDTFEVPPKDTTVGGYIIRIRNFRNEVVGHSSDTRVPNDHFKTYWAEVETCLKELAAHVDKEFLDKIAAEIKNTESMLLTADSNSNLEATLKKWGVEEIYPELVQLQQKADDQANNLLKTMGDVSAIRTMMEDGQHTGNKGSASHQTAPDVNDIMLFVNKEMNKAKDVLENKYEVVCNDASRPYPTQQQKTKALAPIDNPNALTEKEIVEMSKKLGKDWEIFAIYLGYRQNQIDQLNGTYQKQIQTLLRTMLQKWHDVVAQCENENPRKLLAASFAGIGDNRTADYVLLGDANLLKDIKKVKPSPETTQKIEDIDFDAPSTQTMHMTFNFGPSFQIRNFTDKALKQKPGSNTPDIDGVE